MTLYINGTSIPVEIKSDLNVMLERMGLSADTNVSAGPLKAPMPGMILDVMIEPGSEIKKGDPLLILEAMKMENVIKASVDGIIDTVRIAKGDRVEKNQSLITFK